MKLLVQKFAPWIVVLSCGLSAHGDYLYTLNSSGSNSVLDLQVNGSILGSEIGLNGDITVTEQHAGAVTRYDGTVATNFHAGYGANSRISFPGSGSANAINPIQNPFFNTPYNFTPGVDGQSGSGPANYGVTLAVPTGVIDIPPIEIPDYGLIDLGSVTQFNVNMAIRDLQMGITSSGELAIDPITREFDASQLSINVNNGFADVSASLRLEQENVLSSLAVYAALTVLAGQYPDFGIVIGGNPLQRFITVGLGTRVALSGALLANSTTLPGTVTYNSVTENSVLTIPVSVGLAPIDLGIGTIDFGLVGQLSGNATIPNIYHVPEPSSMLLVGMVGLCGTTIRRRPMVR